MADVYTYAVLDLGDVERGLEAMQRRAHQLGPAFQRLKKPLRLDQRDHAKKRQGPDALWAPRAASTAARLLTGGHRPKKLLGRLPTAVSYTANATGVAGVSRALWSAAQQDGATVGRGSRLSARPFLWISDDMLGKAEDVIGGALVRAYGGQ
jgi:hypothetical protein